MNLQSMVHGEIFGRYEAYDYCLRQIEALEYCWDMHGTELLESLKKRINERYLAAVDDWQAVSEETDRKKEREELDYV